MGRPIHPPQSSLEAQTQSESGNSRNESITANSAAATTIKVEEEEEGGEEANSLRQTIQTASTVQNNPLPPLRRPLDLAPPPLPPFVPPSMQHAQASTPPVALTLTGQPRKAANAKVGTRVAHCSGYRPAHVVPPPGLTLYRVCQDYPQSIHGSILKDFLLLSWTAKMILDSLPRAYVIHITARVTNSKNNANIYHKRLKTVRDRLLQENRWNALMSSTPTRQDGRPGHSGFVPTQVLAAPQLAPQVQPPQAPHIPATVTVATPAPSAASATRPALGTSAAWPAVNDPPRGIQASRDSSGNEDNPPVSKARLFTAAAAPLPLDPGHSTAHTDPVPSLPRLVTTPNSRAHPYIPTDVMKRIEATVTKKAYPTARADEWSDTSSDEE